MEDKLLKITPDKEKVLSIIRMVETTLEMIKEMNKNKFPSNVTKEYYEIIRELISIVLLLDGYKSIGDGAHKKQIEYLETNYKNFNKAEINLIDDLRIIRNKISYDGFFVKEDYLNRKLININEIINKLNETINKKLK